MSQKIRQGNDIRIRWSILDADEHPYILEGRNVAVELNVGTKRVRIRSLEIESNVLIFTYYGKDQKYTGSYILKFIENEGQVDMVTFDTKDAFTLVEHSWQAIDEGETPETVQLEFVTVTSELHSSVGPAGTSAGFGEVTASVDSGVGTPSVEVTTSGPNTAKNFAFAFHNLKGQDGSDAEVTAQNIQSALGYVPVAPSDISQFITKTVDDLTNYYLKSETYTKAEVEALVAGISGVSFVVANSLPTASASTMGKIYLIPSADPQTQNVKDEFITLESGGSYSWEQIGSTAIDLDGYVTDEDLATALADYVLSSSITDVLRYSSQSLTTEQQTQARTNIGAGTYSKPSGGIPSSDMASAVQTSLGKADSAYQKPSTGIPSTDMASAVQTSLGKADSAYQKPSGGIPSTDLASAVQTSLGKADSAYQKPGTGIPSTDLASAVQTSLGKADTALQSFTETDPTVPSWAKAQNPPTEIFWATYGTTTTAEIDAAIAAGKVVMMNYQSKTYILSTYSSDSYYTFTAAADDTIFNIRVSKIDDSYGTPFNLTFQLYSNKVTSWQQTPSDNKYPSEKLVKDSLDGKQPLIDSTNKLDYSLIDNTPTIPTVPVTDVTVGGASVVSNGTAVIPAIPSVSGLESAANKVTSLSSSSTDTEYPSAKCVYDLIGDVETLINAL